MPPKYRAPAESPLRCLRTSITTGPVCRSGDLAHQARCVQLTCPSTHVQSSETLSLLLRRAVCCKHVMMQCEKLAATGYGVPLHPFSSVETASTRAYEGTPLTTLK